MLKVWSFEMINIMTSCNGFKVAKDAPFKINPLPICPKHASYLHNRTHLSETYPVSQKHALSLRNMPCPSQTCPVPLKYALSLLTNSLYNSCPISPRIAKSLQN